MYPQATRTLNATVVLRAAIIAGLGALIVMVVLMIQPPASASAAPAAARPCAISVHAVVPCQNHAPCQKCSPCQNCAHCQKCAA